jgi:Na+/phosphate symporter
LHFSEMYHKYCESVESSIAEKVQRPLTEEEKRGIWNVGSLLLLESFERAILATPSPKDASYLLSRQISLSEERLKQTREQLIEKVTNLLQRSLSQQENNNLRAIVMVEDALRMIEQITDIPSDKREAVFQQAITNHNAAKRFI